MIRLILIMLLSNYVVFSQVLSNFYNGENYISESNMIEKENVDLKLSSLNYNLLENIIDPTQYLVGPGDTFLFNMLSADGLVNIDLVVNPTGEILVPAIGNIFVYNFTLDKTIYIIKEECLKKYPNSNVHISLLNIRNFKVQIKGINNIVSYVEASQILRVSDVLEDIIKQYNISSGLKISERNINIIRNNKIINVDLLSFRRFGEKIKNPTLKQGDIIELKLEENYVGIYGGIKMPGRYEIVNNESLEQLINLSGGFTKNADINNIEITRFINDTDKEIININHHSLISNLFLQDEDHIIVRYKQDYKRQDLVTVNGEVKYPGLYSIEHDSTTIKEIIEKCGGLSTKADLSKIMINNNYISNFEDPELNRINLIPNQYRSDEEKSYIKARSRSEKGSINSSDINFTDRILSFTLNRNDIITIPEAIDYVEVLGGVYYPGRYPFYDNYSFDDYINLAGGYTKTARNKKYIVKNSNGQRIPFNKNINIENGDIVFVVEKIEYNTWERFKEIISVLGQLATLVVVIQSATG